MRAHQSCSCGVAVDHVVARRRTADGETLQLWHSGDISGRFGYPSGLKRAQGRVALEARRRAWAVVELYDWAELAALVASREAEVRAEQARVAG